MNLMKNNSQSTPLGLESSAIITYIKSSFHKKISKLHFHHNTLLTLVDFRKIVDIEKTADLMVRSLLFSSRLYMGAMPFDEHA